MRNGRQASSPHGSQASGVTSPAFVLLLVAILCVAAFLRFYRLDAQSFWNDEGNSARIAERSLDLIVEGAAGDIHPPGYYLLLHVWRGLFGPGEFALRSLSALAGVALVLLTCLLASQLFGRSVGLMAAVLSAVSPLAVYYSQEARMYALLAALSAASTYAAFRVWRELKDGFPIRARDRESARELLWSAAYALISAAGLYTHYAFLFVFVAHNVGFGLRWFVGMLRSDPRWRSLVIWVGAQVAAGLLYLPWLPAALNAAGWSSAGVEYQLGSALLTVARVLAVGVTQPLGEARIAVAGAAGLLIAGLWPWLSRRAKRGAAQSGWWGTAGLAVYLAIPLGLFFGFDLYKPAWLKFLVVLLPPFHVLVARGARRIATLASRLPVFSRSPRRMVGTVISSLLIATLLVLIYPSLRNLYFDPAYARDDYRQLAADIREARRPGDAIVLNAPNQWEVFTYYYPDRDVYPAPYRPRPGAVSSFLDPLLQEHERLFVLYWGDAESDPERRLESWLASHAYKAGDQWYGDVRLATYGVAPLPQEPDVALDVAFGERLLLQGYSLPEDALAPGEIVPVTLFWRAMEAMEQPYKVSVQMLDVDGRLVSQMDTVPGDGLEPTPSWRFGEALIDRYGVTVPADAAPGRYALIVAVYHAFDGERLPVERADATVDDALVLAHLVVGTRQ